MRLSPRPASLFDRVTSFEYFSNVSSVFLAAFCFCLISPTVRAQSEPAYSALRELALGKEAFTVSDLELKRDAGTFHFHSGTLCSTNAVNGMITGAVFVGDGNFVLSPPSESERKNLKLFTKEDEFVEKFDHLVLRFTDSTYSEVKKAATPTTPSCDAGLLKETQNTTRHKLRRNLEIEILGEVLSPEPRGLFVAFIHGRHYRDKEIFEIDPNRNTHQIDFWTYEDNKWGDWASFGYSQPRPSGSFGRTYHIDRQQLDTAIEKNANLSAKATATVVSQRNGLRVVPLMLFHTLRVQSVTAGGQPIAYIQEDKNADSDFAVILAKPLTEGERIDITTTYSGKEAIIDEGGGNYFPVAREDWYPNTNNGSLGEYSSYDMIFRIPKGMKIASTGVLVSDTTDGPQNITTWKSESPQTVAGFNFGKFKVEEVKLTKPEYFIQSYANEESPSWVQDLKLAAEGDNMPAQGSHSSGVALGSMSTTWLNKKALTEGELAVGIYTDYFGPSQFTHLQITQQTACNFGQSWPELVWIPICYYFDSTVRHELGMDWGDRGYWKVVTPHEVAHQWWGHTIGFSSGRDQWMSEGFADMSASLYLSFIEKDQKKFISFWNDERELLLEKNAQGFRAIDVGPLTMGYRSSNSRVGSGVTRRLIYPKGAYVLHMLRMMLRDNKTGDAQFKAMMHDFVTTYKGKPATTEDFKAIVEKHMTREMDLDNNKKMDWFFNDYVYGTQLPSYKLDYAFDADASGDTVFSFKVTQSNVDDKFHMLVPIYLELEEGKIVFVGRAHFIGNATVEGKVPLKGLKARPRRALVNYFDDVLASPN